MSTQPRSHSEEAARPRTGPRLPDFIIGGAMKSGTSTLHYTLSRHKGISMPNTEIHFFSVGDIEEHAGSFRRYGSQWAFHDYEHDFERYRSWYERFFDNADPHQIIGEDSSSYLSSEKAPTRIAELLPEVQLIFLLRDPVARTYSHYWHSLRKGRATYRFEEQLQYNPGNLLRRSFYRRGIERYLEVFPRENITFLIFEDFIHNMQERIDTLCATLGLSESIDLSEVNTTERNPSRVPYWPRLLAWQNRLFRRFNMRQNRPHLPDMPQSEFSFAERVIDSLNFRLRHFNLDVDRSYPPMDEKTRAFLQKLFAKENRGLSELIGIDVQRYWPYMEA